MHADNSESHTFTTSIDVSTALDVLHLNGLEPFRGAGDELALWQGALTASQIAGHYNNGSGMDYCGGQQGGLSEGDSELGAVGTLVQRLWAWLTGQLESLIAWLTPDGALASPVVDLPAAQPAAPAADSFPAGMVVVKYYYAGSVRLAQRIEGSSDASKNGLYYLLGDHLGSASVILKQSGGSLSLSARLLYKPWGELRYGSAAGASIDRLFTGQRFESEIGLYHYEARWYLPDDLKKLYQLCGGVSLFRSSVYSMSIVSPKKFLLANAVLFTGISEEDLYASKGDISWSWFILGEGENGQYLTIDLSPERSGRCYDSFWDCHAMPGYSQIVAKSFSEMLLRLFENQGNHWYWLQPEFESYGDAYCPRRNK